MMGCWMNVSNPDNSEHVKTKLPVEKKHYGRPTITHMWEELY